MTSSSPSTNPLFTGSDTPLKLFISTGDPSGDGHGARVVQSLKELQPQCEIHGVGGEAMAQAGVELLADQSKMQRVGFGSYTGIPYHWWLGEKILKHCQSFQPHAVLLIDYGGFHLSWLARRLKQKGYKVYYYIPPQLWASRRNRITNFKRFVDHVFCIFPFEETLYNEEGVSNTYVGHPLASQIPPPITKAEFCQTHNLDPNSLLVGLFPGSRKMEINYLLPEIMGALPKIQEEAKRRWPNRPETQTIQFVLAKASNLNQAYFEKRLRQALTKHPQAKVTVVEHANYPLMAAADAAIAASGTVTLELALYDTPMIILYRGPWLMYQIATRLVYLPCIGLPNILSDMEHPVAPELWQYKANPDTIASTFIPFIDPDSPQHQRAKSVFSTIRDNLKQSTRASNEVALGILSLLGMNTADSKVAEHRGTTTNTETPATATY